MNPGGAETETWRRARDIFYEVIEAEPELRDELLERLCADRADLREKVRLLLDGANRPAFLDVPVVDLSSTVAEPPLPERIGRYLIIGRVGRGGMGEVLRAQDPVLGRAVALKTVPIGRESAGDRARLAREARSASALNHPNIVTIHDFGSDAGVDFIAMEFVEGETLRERLDHRDTALPVLLGYARQAATGIAQAHAAGVIHRDLKPRNIMVTPTGLVKVLDFGIAKFAAGSADSTGLTAPGGVLGTPAYMSPEQAAGEPVDARSDIFSFGTILYEVAGGTRPFEGTGSLETLRQVMLKEPAAVQTVNPAVPGRLSALIERCLRKRPAERPESMAWVESELAAILEGKGPTRRVPLVMAAAVLAGLGVGWRWWPRGQDPVMPRIEVQRMVDGQPEGGVFTADADAEFRGGWKFRLVFEGARPGFVYVIHEGDPARNEPYWLLHPPPDSNPDRTGWLVFDGAPGIERLRLVRSERRAPEIEPLSRTAPVPEAALPAMREWIARQRSATLLELRHR